MEALLTSLEVALPLLVVAFLSTLGSSLASLDGLAISLVETLGSSLGELPNLL